jgi:riboflavin kinase/FMN adenylyltransferase
MAEPSGSGPVPATRPPVAVTRDLAAVDRAPSAVTVGVFDGVHAGHQALLARVVARARADDLRAVAITFDRHPLAILSPDREPAALQTLDDKVASLVETGVDHVHVLTFDVAASHEPAEDFVRRVLVDGFSARAVLIGGNFRFGHGAAGDIDLLARLGAEHRFDARAVELVASGDTAVSSTMVRHALAIGDVAAAAAALGRPHRVRGTVVRGDGRGRSIGVPTANVAVPAGMAVPAGGVYGTRVILDGVAHDAVTNIGTRPTVAGRNLTVESHLLDVDLDLYDRDVAVDFVARLRDEVRFDSVDALVAQIRADIERAREVLRS